MIDDNAVRENVAANRRVLFDKIFFLRQIMRKVVLNSRYTLENVTNVNPSSG